jgi:general secretion pathway protein M
MERLIATWRAMSPRERRLVGVGGALLLLAAAFLLLLEPAWRGRAALGRDLPLLREQLAQMLALQDEWRQIAGESTTRPAGGTVASRIAALEQTLRSAGLMESVRKLEANGELIELRFAAAPHERWFAWLSTALGETRLRVVDLSVAREAGPGQLSARLVLEAPRAAR